MGPDRSVHETDHSTFSTVESRQRGRTCRPNTARDQRQWLPEMRLTTSIVGLARLEPVSKPVLGHKIILNACQGDKLVVIIGESFRKGFPLVGSEIVQCFVAFLLR